MNGPVNHSTMPESTGPASKVPAGPVLKCQGLHVTLRGDFTERRVRREEVACPQGHKLGRVLTVPDLHE
jgi:hypothetical protein